MGDKPKRPMSAYLMWLNSAREKIKAENPGVKVTEVAKKGGEMWRAMKDKSEWEEKAAKAKEQYTKDLEEYNANGGGGGIATAKPQKRAKKGRAVAVRAAANKKPKREPAEDEDDDDEDDDEEGSD